MNGLFVGLAVTAGFILGVRVGLALGHRNARAQLAKLSKKRAAEK